MNYPNAPVYNIGAFFMPVAYQSAVAISNFGLIAASLITKFVLSAFILAYSVLFSLRVNENAVTPDINTNAAAILICSISFS
ncbi:hypothetical protein ABIB62_004484 [Mucilaginibacter sp. UYP25]